MFVPVLVAPVNDDAVALAVPTAKVREGRNRIARLLIKQRMIVWP